MCDHLSFFEYHKLHSAKCAIALKQNQILINWSKGVGKIMKGVVADTEVSKCNFAMYYNQCLFSN